MIKSVNKLYPTQVNQLMAIWLQGNILAHPFIPVAFWETHFDEVKRQLQRAEVIYYEYEGEIVGFIGLVSHHIAGLFVDEDFQRQGIGTFLLEQAQQKHPHLTLAVYQKNRQALGFYQRRGFRVQKEQVDLHSREKEFLMEWAQS